MGHPVVHFEVIGKDGKALQDYYSSLFGWNIHADNPMNYGTVDREENLSDAGVGIGGGVAGGPEGYDGHVTFYVEVPDVEESLAKAASLGGSTIFGPEPMESIGLILGQFTDPEGHVIGVMSPLS